MLIGAMKSLDPTEQLGLIGPRGSAVLASIEPGGYGLQYPLVEASGLNEPASAKSSG